MINNIRRGQQQQPFFLVKLDALKEVLRSATDAQMSRAASELAPMATAECCRQTLNTTLLHTSVEGLAKAIKEAAMAAVAKSGPVIEQAALSAVSALKQTEQQDLTRQVIQQAAAIDRDKLLLMLDERLADAKVKGQGVQLRAVVQEVTEAFIEDHYQKAVSTLTHYMLNDMVGAVLQRDVLPQMEVLVREAYSQHLMLAVNNESVRPTVTAAARSAVQRAATEACRQVWTACMSPVNRQPLTAGVSAPQNVLQLQRPVLAQNVLQRQMGLQPQVAAPLPAPAAQPAHPAPARPLNHHTPTPADLQEPSPDTPPQAVAGTAGVLTPATTPNGPAGVPTSTNTPDETSSRPASVYLVDRTTGEWKKFNLDAASPLDDPDSDPPIHRLPDEVLSRVLGLLEPLHLLTVCSRVCRRWHALSRSGALWRRQTLCYKPDDVHAKQRFCHVLRLAPRLGLLDLGAAGRGSRCVPKYVTKAVLQTLCVVRKLRIVAKGVDANFVMQVLHKHGPNLEELDVTTSVELNAREVFAVIDAMGLVGLRLAGRFDEEYNFGPRRMGAPRRALETLDLADFLSSSGHTAASLVSANMASLSSVMVPADADVALMVSVSLCSKLVSLSVPADVLDWTAPPPLSTVLRLTVRRAAMHSIRVFRSDLSAGGPDADTTLLLPVLDELVLDGVPAPEDVPRRVRECYQSVRSVTFLGTNMGGKILDVVRAMPGLQCLVLDGERKATDVVLRGLLSAAPRLRTLRVCRSLICAGGLCWQPVEKFFKSQLPQVSTQLEVDCSCSP